MRTDRLADIHDVAEYLRLTPSAIYVQRSRGAEPGSLGVKVGRKILWDPEVLQAWVRERHEQATA